MSITGMSIFRSRNSSPGLHSHVAGMDHVGRLAIDLMLVSHKWYFVQNERILPRRKHTARFCMVLQHYVARAVEGHVGIPRSLMLVAMVVAVSPML